MYRAVLILAVVAQSGNAQPPAQWPPELINDATLNDVFFVDPQTGWAVGDRGVIRHTSDGGKNWQLEPSPVGCRLETVHFADRQHGWIGGGWTQPYTHSGRGVILRTDDGGRQWQELSGHMLPIVRKLYFPSVRYGLAITDASLLFPASLFRTNDEGRGWKTTPGSPTSGWVSAAWRDENFVVLAARDGTIAVVQSGKVLRERLPIGPRQRIRQIGVTGQHVFLVGDAGLLLRSSDKGKTWRDLRQTIPSGIASEFDFLTLATYEDHLWITGQPGTSVLATDSGGQRWQVARTGQSLPIHGLHFIDARSGWAVGSQGTILATTDGGQTWSPQRAVGDRVAVLGIYSRPDQVDWELVAHLSTSEAYRTQVLIIGRTPLALNEVGATDAELRYDEAAVLAGASGATLCWDFPLREASSQRPASKIDRFWTIRSAETVRPATGLDRLTERLVRAIRTWRPDMIVSSIDPEVGVASLVRTALQAAIERAASPGSYADQLAVGGLEPWQVQRVWTRADEKLDGATTKLSASKLALPLGKSLARIANDCRALVSPAYRAGESVLAFSEIGSSGVTAKRRSFSAGLAIPRQSAARRGVMAPAVSNVQQFARQAQLRRNIEAIATKLSSPTSQAGVLVAQINDLTRGLDRRSSGYVLLGLAERLRQTGQHEAASAVRQMLIDLHRDHPVRDGVILEHLRYETSAEFTWWQQARRVKPLAAPAVDNSMRAGSTPDRATSITSVPVSSSAPAGRFTPRSSLTPRSPSSAQPDSEWQRTFSLASPLLRSRPDVQLAVAAVKRQAVAPQAALRDCRQVQNTTGDPHWQARAAAESWLRTKQGRAPLPVWRCVGSDRPRLDGQLTDRTWQLAQSTSLSGVHPDDQTLRASAALSRDAEFLYVAARCELAGGAVYQATNARRVRDADLTAEDRIVISLDVNRDHMSNFQLTLDHRGWTGESCLEDAAWNPTWYVAARTDDSTWTVEAAIPLSELVPHPLASDDAWALAVRRVVPGVGAQTWPATSPDEGPSSAVGLLLFD